MSSSSLVDHEFCSRLATRGGIRCIPNVYTARGIGSVSAGKPVEDSPASAGNQYDEYRTTRLFLSARARARAFSTNSLVKHRRPENLCDDICLQNRLFPTFSRSGSPLSSNYPRRDEGALILLSRFGDFRRARSTRVLLSTLALSAEQHVYRPRCLRVHTNGCKLRM